MLLFAGRLNSWHGKNLDICILRNYSWSNQLPRKPYKLCQPGVSHTFLARASFRLSSLFLWGGFPKWPKMFGLGLLGGSWLFFVRKLVHKYERPSCWASRKNCNRKINLVFTATNPNKNTFFNFLVQLSVGEELFRKFLKNPSALGNNALVHIVGTAKQLFGWERFHWTILTAIWKIQCLKNISAKL